jgi:hypothetical protein
VPVATSTQSSPTSAKPRFLAAKRAAAALGIPYSTLRLAVFSGELSVLKLGRTDSQRQHWYIEAQELENWIERRRERMRVA